MLLFESEGALFQLEEREPAFAPLSQLAPLPRRSFRGPLSPGNPTPEHPAGLGEVNRRDLVLMLRDELAMRAREEPQIETQQREIGIRRVEF